MAKRTHPAPRSRKLVAPFHTNTPTPFDLGLVQSIRVNRSAVEARAVELGTRRSFKVEAQVAAYLAAIRCIDLTTLAGDDTPGRVERLCAKALAPLETETKIAQRRPCASIPRR
jgi:deoxyribose-phosphate aldolase